MHFELNSSNKKLRVLFENNTFFLNNKEYSYLDVQKATCRDGNSVIFGNLDVVLKNGEIVHCHYDTHERTKAYIIADFLNRIAENETELSATCLSDIKYENIVRWEFISSTIKKHITLFMKTNFCVDGKFYKYVDISKVSISYPNLICDGSIDITLKNSEIIHCLFSAHQREDAGAVYRFLNEYDGEDTLEKEDSWNDNLVKDDSLAAKLYQICVSNGYGKGMTKGWSIDHFGVVVDALMPDEQILFPFIGARNYQSINEQEGFFAHIVTNKRLIIGQRKLVGKELYTVNFEYINSIKYSSELLMGIITVETMSEKFTIGLNKDYAYNIYERLLETLNDIKKPVDPYEALKKLKELLDMGVLTQEEFDIKKKNYLKKVL